MLSNLELLREEEDTETPAKKREWSQGRITIQRDDRLERLREQKRQLEERMRNDLSPEDFDQKWPELEKSSLLKRRRWKIKNKSRSR